MQQTILITGTSRGIGAYLTKVFLDRGWLVAGCSRNVPEWADAFSNYRHFSLNIDDESAVGEMFSDLRKDWDQLDVTINNAGIASMNSMLLTPAKTWNQIFSTNTLGTFLCCREAAKWMARSGRGRIVNFTSVAAPLSLEGESAYASSKAAVEKLTQVLAREVGSKGVTVNAIGSTPVDTDLIKGVPSVKMEALLQRQAIPRKGKMEDIVNVIDFFIQPESDFITAQTIYLGGVHAG